MLFLYIYGDNIESYLGRTNFLIFYILGGVSAAFLQAFFSGGVDVPMIGAITGTAAKGGGWIYANGSSIGTSVSVKAHLTMDAEL